MDGDVLYLASSSSSSSAAAGVQKDAVPKSSSLSQNQQEHKAAEELWAEYASHVGDRLLSTEEQVTLITESMTVTSTDQEKLLLLNKNTELRRVNKELMKVNEEWDQVYHSTTLSLQHRNEALGQENSGFKQLNSRLLLKVEHEQSAKEYYAQTLMEELKKNQELQRYIRLLESRTHHPDKDCTPAKQGSLSAGVHSPVLCPPTSNPPGGSNRSPCHVSGYLPSSPSSSASSTPGSRRQGQSQRSTTQTGVLGDTRHEVHDLKGQLEALKCQTQIYEAEYEIEHNDLKHTLQENRRLKRRMEEMCQQVALLQEQLKVYEDDFRRERSDKQMLQRLLLKKTSPKKGPVLIHRCNNEQPPLEGEKRTENGERGERHHLLCPKHSERDKSQSTVNEF